MDLFIPEYFEKHVTTTVPIVNVDLLIKDRKGRILLSWRDDGMFKGWHVPGRIVRFKESLDEAVLNCYWYEINIIPNKDFTKSIKFIEWFETIRDVEIRGHFITFLYKIPLLIEPEYLRDNLKWFDKCPEDLIPEQERYRKYFGK